MSKYRLIEDIKPQEKLCANCEHYIQHYVLSSFFGDFIMTRWGHCCVDADTKDIFKAVGPFDKCDNFTRRLEEE